MPELPEVETVKRTLEPRLRGRRIERAILGDYQRTVATPQPDEFRERMRGRTITGMGRRGKFILMNLSSGETVTIHLRMTGSLSITEPDAPADNHVHLRLELDDGRQLRYRDVRKFGRWSLLTPEQYAVFDQSLGVEPFDPMLDDTHFHTLLTSRRRILKPLLLDQTFIAGIGNIYADEALFRARIHPRRRSHELAAEESSKLLTEIRAVLEESLENRGTTLRDYRDGNEEPGGNLTRLQIYARAAGEPCPRCGGAIVREVIGQRGTKLCPRCQPLP